THAPAFVDTPTPTSTPDPCAPVGVVVSSPNAGAGNNYLEGVGVASANDVWAVGYYQNGTGTPFQTLVERWNGTAWSVVSSPNAGIRSNFLNGVAAVSANDVWAVGYYYNGSVNQTLVEHWDGASWSVVSSPNAGASDNYLFAVSAV